MSNSDDEILAAAREGFLDEAQDMLRQFEQCLLVMESDPEDRENLNAAFRAAHTIKGTAGLFGFDAVVAFTHDAETLLEALRSGKAQVSEAVTAVLLKSRDQMELLLDEIRTGAEHPDTAERSRAIGEELRAVMGAPAAAATAAAPAPAAAVAAPVPTGPDAWQISLRFGIDALRNGLDPLSFIRYLGTLGEVLAITTLDEAVPGLEHLDAEACHLGFEIRLATDATRAQIEQVFEFCADDCDIALLGPTAAPADWQALLDRRTARDASDDDGAAAAQALLALWLAQGVALPLRELPQGSALIDTDAAAADADTSTNAGPDAAAPTETAALAVAIERRAPEGSDRRRNEPERRSGSRDRRAGDEARFIRVRADKLDQLIDLVGELVIAGSGAQLVADEEDSPRFAEAAQRICDLVEAARDGALALRMVPVGDTFARFQRVVRDISKSLGKDVELVITGGDTELDKSMVEVIADPLMHLVRNSMDHGIEPADDRVAAGKPTQGRLALNAYHEAGSIVIEVTDDGRGLDPAKLKRKAAERGLIPADAEMPDHEAFQLIFLPGFSTAEQVTDLSGRGVGMDVVRRNIEALRGHISLVSQLGRGTTTQIRLPLTLAMIDGFLTQVGGTSFVLPLSVVAECIDVPPECLSQPERVCGCFDLRGEVLPYLDLSRFYGMPPLANGRRALVMVREGHHRIGLVVDRLMGEHQTVIKPLSPIFRHLKAISGSTILGSGDVALVLDVPGLMACATQFSQAQRQGGTVPAAAH